MSKKRYTFDFIIQNEDAINKIRCDFFLSNHIREDNGSIITLSMSNLKAKDVLNQALMLSSAIRCRCCFAVDGSPIRGTKKLSFMLAECMDEFLWAIKSQIQSEEISTKGFERWLEDALDSCKLNDKLKGFIDFDPYRVKIFPLDFLETDEVAFCVGYDPNSKGDKDNG